MRCCTAARRRLGSTAPVPLGKDMARRPKSSIPRFKRRRRDTRSWPRRILGWAIRLVAAFFLISILWVGLYRLVPPPITLTMLGDVFAGRGLHKDWMPISE